MLFVKMQSNDSDSGPALYGKTWAVYRKSGTGEGYQASIDVDVDTELFAPIQSKSSYLCVDQIYMTTRRLLWQLRKTMRGYLTMVTTNG